MESVVSYPDRGVGGKNTYRGNCSPKLIEDIIAQYGVKYLSDDMADHMLTGDDRYIYGDNYEQYEADTDIYEYYHMNGSCYSVKETAGAFAKELTVSKQAVLRTETELDNAGFQEIVHEVMERMGDMKLKGYYRLGVVYLERVSDD